MLWEMLTGRQRERRLLALDVRQLVWIGRFDAERYLRTGTTQEWIQDGELPDTPLLREAMERTRREMAEEEERMKKGLMP